MNLQYAAGLIDGEGYIGIQKSGGTFHVRLKVAMADKGRPALLALQSLFGGTIYHEPPRGERNSPKQVWILTGEKATDVIARLRPWLLIKAPCADIALEFQLMHKGLAPNASRGRSWTPEAKDRAEMLSRKLKDANRVGPEPTPPTLPKGRPLAIYRWGWWWEPEETLMGPVEFAGQFPTSGIMVAGHVYQIPSRPT